MAPHNAKYSFHSASSGRVAIALLIVSVTCVYQVHSCAQGPGDDDYKSSERQLLIQRFETALLNDNNALWKLQQVFFNPDSKQSPEKVCLSVYATVDKVAQQCDCPSPNWPAFHLSEFGYWYFNSYYELQLSDGTGDVSQLAKLMTMSGCTSVFYAFDPSFYTIMRTLSSAVSVSIPYIGMEQAADDLYYYSNDYVEIDISLGAELDEMPCWDDAVYALRSVLMWAKVYARKNINVTLQTKDEMDRSSVSDGVRLTNVVEKMDQCLSHAANILIEPRNTWILVFCLFYVSNLLVLTSVLVNFRKVFLWLQGQRKQTKTLYKASAIVLTCVNIISLMSDLYIIVSNGIDVDIALDAIMTMVPAKVPLVLLILILETSVACFNTVTHESVQNQTNCTNTKCQRVTHAFAFCQIIWFVHKVVNDGIISALFFLLAPAQTLGVVMLLLSILGSAIVFVSILIYDFKGCNKMTCAPMTCVTLNGLMVCLLLFVITLLYIVLVDNGLKSAGMGGLILSLVPPFAVFTIGLIINQKYFKSTSVTATPERGERRESITIQVDNEEEEERILQQMP